MTTTICVAGRLRLNAYCLRPLPERFMAIVDGDGV
jgi:hypothetical protein